MKRICFKCASLLLIFLISILLQNLFISKRIINNIFQSLRGYVKSFPTGLTFKLKRFLLFYLIINLVMMRHFFSFSFLTISPNKHFSFFIITLQILHSIAHSFCVVKIIYEKFYVYHFYASPPLNLKDIMFY